MSSRLVRGCCPLDCQDACAWVANVEDGRVTGVAGSKEHPFTRGVLCAKVNDYHLRTYSSERLLHPLKRVGMKGQGFFERISWEQALEEIAARFSAIAREHGPEALMPMHDMGSAGVLQRRALMRLFHALGASRLHGSLCGAAGNAIVAAGHPIGFDPEEIADSELVLIWGTNLLTTAHHHWRFCAEARKRRGARLVAIDPRRTRTARICDLHLPIRPGTDAVLAAALARILVTEDLADLEYARSAAVDLDRLLEEIDPWTPEQSASVCGIRAEDIHELGRMFGHARPATIRAGIGPQQNRDGELYVRALSALAILGGHCRHRGGGLFLEAYPTLDNRAPERPDLSPADTRSLDRARLGEILTAQDLDPPVKGLMVWGTNPLVSQLDAEAVRRGLLREDLFTVVLEHFMTDTARHADIVLPSTTQLEHFDVQGSWGHHYVGANHPAIAPLGEARPHSEVMRGLAERMGLDHPALRESDQEIARSALPEGFDFDGLLATGWTKTFPPASDPTSRGPVLEIAIGLPGPDSPSLPGAGEPNRLRLLSPKPHFFLNSTFVNMPRQRTKEGSPTIEMNQADAAELGVNDGEDIFAETGLGMLRARVKITADIVPGAAALEGKWWWTESAEESPVVNRLGIGAWTPVGQSTYNDLYVTIRRPGGAQPNVKSIHSEGRQLDANLRPAAEFRDVNDLLGDETPTRETSEGLTLTR